VWPRVRQCAAPERAINSARGYRQANFKGSSCVSGERGDSSMRRLLVAAALVLTPLTLSACATETYYQAQTERGGYGYAENRIEANRYRVSFRGNSLTDRETVENYLIFRAAELTLQQGYDYFVVADRGTHERNSLRSYGPYYPGFAPNYWFYTRRGLWRPFYDPFFDEPRAYEEITRYEASAEIAMFHGQKPGSNANAFDAHEVVANLQSKVTRAPPAT